MYHWQRKLAKTSRVVKNWRLITASSTVDGLLRLIYAHLTATESMAHIPDGQEFTIEVWIGIYYHNHGLPCGRRPSSNAETTSAMHRFRSQPGRPQTHQIVEHCYSRMEWDSWLFNLAWSLLFMCREPFRSWFTHTRMNWCEEEGPAQPGFETSTTQSREQPRDWLS